MTSSTPPGAHDDDDDDDDAREGARLLVGLFVGGRGSRMGGVAKGLLRAPGSELGLVERMAAELARALPRAELRLVGDASAYRQLELPSIADEPPEIGPLGGLHGLLLEGERAGAPAVLAVSCDLPYVTSELFRRLARHTPALTALVACQENIRNPLFARYATGSTLSATRRALADGKRSLQAVLDRLEPHVACLPLAAHEAALLQDWDTQSDVHHAKPE